MESTFKNISNGSRSDFRKKSGHFKSQCIKYKAWKNKEKANKAAEERRQDFCLLARDGRLGRRFRSDRPHGKYKGFLQKTRLFSRITKLSHWEKIIREMSYRSHRMQTSYRASGFLKPNETPKVTSRGIKLGLSHVVFRKNMVPTTTKFSPLS